MSQTMRLTSPTAATVTPPADTDCRVGPKNSSPRSVHIHTGRPTRPLVDPGGGAIRISGARMTSDAIACLARTRGSTGGPAAGAEPFGTNTSIVVRPEPSTRGQTMAYIAPSAGDCPCHRALVDGGCGCATVYVHGSGELAAPLCGVVPPPTAAGPAPVSAPPPGVDDQSRHTPVRGLVLAHPTGGSAAAMPVETTPITTRAASTAPERRTPVSMACPCEARARSPTRAPPPRSGTG